ncbi:hypothetical protein LINGRAHAP2_LOCUS1329 [Linum grandiflorum]
MKQSQTICRTHPSPCTKRYHFNLLPGHYIKRYRTIQKPLWIKRHRILPGFRIPPYLGHHEIHRTILRHGISDAELCSRLHCVRQQEMRRGMTAQSFQHDRLQVWQLLQILLFYFLFLRIAN